MPPPGACLFMRPRSSIFDGRHSMSIVKPPYDDMTSNTTDAQIRRWGMAPAALPMMCCIWPPVGARRDTESPPRVMLTVRQVFVWRYEPRPVVDIAFCAPRYLLRPYDIKRHDNAAHWRASYRRPFRRRRCYPAAGAHYQASSRPPWRRMNTTTPRHLSLEKHRISGVDERQSVYFIKEICRRHSNGRQRRR